MATQIFFEKLHSETWEDEPILTSIFFKGVGEKPPARDAKVFGNMIFSGIPG